MYPTEAKIKIYLHGKSLSQKRDIPFMAENVSMWTHRSSVSLWKPATNKISRHTQQKVMTKSSIKQKQKAPYITLLPIISIAFKAPFFLENSTFSYFFMNFFFIIYMIEFSESEFLILLYQSNCEQEKHLIHIKVNPNALVEDLKKSSTIPQ